MTVYIGLFEFEGPNLSPPDLQDEPGVYAILHCFQEEYELVETGEHDSLRDWAQSIDFEKMRSQCSGTLSLAAYYTDLPQAARQAIVESILKEFDEELRIEPQRETVSKY